MPSGTPPDTDIMWHCRLNRQPGMLYYTTPDTMDMQSTQNDPIREETLESISTCVQTGGSDLNWTCPFILPGWLAAWWPHFSTGWKPYLFSVHHQGSVVGIAPLMRRGRLARLIGDGDVCDHLDVVVATAHGDHFCRNLLDHLAQDGIEQLELSPVREDSNVMTRLLPTADRWGARISCDPQAQLYAMSLPDSWEAYLQGLSGKERHEIRRKFRRLRAAGKANLRCIEDRAQVPDAMEQFISLFRANRKDKANFMTGSMPVFFRSLALNLASGGFLKLYFLDLDDQTIAATFCIAHRSTVYLYNNGYDDAFRSLSVGLLSKVLTIRDSIRNGWQFYDFLKGSETYKRRLGGKSVNISRCTIALNR
jgi:CelD/BcsL family acetyltransferase involved in cellulose biosynthesis